MARTAKFPPASHGTGLEASRSDAAGDAPGSAGAAGSQKRGRGRPPKSKSGDVSAQPASKPSGRPKRSVAAAATAAGRPRRSSTVRAAESQVTSGDGSRKRGRPKKDDVAAVPALAMKRGRNQVDKKTVGRPKKAIEGATGQGAADPKELKKKTALLQKKVKLAAEKLKIAVSAIKEVQELAAGL